MDADEFRAAIQRGFIADLIAHHPRPRRLDLRALGITRPDDVLPNHIGAAILELQQAGLITPAGIAASASPAAHCAKVLAWVLPDADEARAYVASRPRRRKAEPVQMRLFGEVLA